MFEIYVISSRSVRSFFIGAASSAQTATTNESSRINRQPYEYGCYIVPYSHHLQRYHYYEMTYVLFHSISSYFSSYLPSNSKRRKGKRLTFLFVKKCDGESYICSQIIQLDRKYWPDTKFSLLTSVAKVPPKIAAGFP